MENVLVEQVKDHEVRIRVIENETTELRVELKHLIKSMSTLTGWVKALVMAIVGVVLSLGVWFFEQIITRVM